MKAILEFNLPEDREEFEDCQNGWKYRLQFESVWEHVFRPRHKHGYANARLNELTDDPKVQEAMDILEELYRGCLRED